MSIVWFLSLLFTAIGLFLSLWIVIPAPNYPLLILGVSAPEVSPWLVIVNAIALVLVIVQFNSSWLNNTLLICSLLALCLSSLPLVQITSTNRRLAEEVEAVLGTDYLNKIPEATRQLMRPQPFILADVFRGIKLKPVRISRGILFANPDGIELRLNVYRPLEIGKYPTLVILYGGAWQQGTAENDESFSRYIAAQGYSVIAIDYRHAPQYKFPVQLEDVRTALKYIEENATDLEVDSDRLALMGRSAGGHLASLIAYQQDTLPIRAVINYYGPSNLTEGYHQPPIPNPINNRKMLEEFLGGTPEELPQLYRQASPFYHIKPSLPPSLLVYPSRDHVIQAKFGRRLYQKLKEKENQAILLTIPWAEHAFDAIFFGVSNQLVLYYTERFLAWALKGEIRDEG
ncbi:MAG: alpha/beta hydrolase fold domain-containing protein [Pleurocapsa sp.]